MSGDNVFFAIFPKRKAALKITRLANRLRRAHGFKQRPFQAGRFHISLQNLSQSFESNDDLVRLAGKAAAELSAQPFDVSFNHVDSFKGKSARHPLVMLGDAESVHALCELQQMLGVTLKKAMPGSKRVAGRFTPHVTLLYGDYPIDEHPVEVVTWRVEELVLVRSLYGRTKYIPLGRWRLSG